MLDAIVKGFQSFARWINENIKNKQVRYFVFLVILICIIIVGFLYIYPSLSEGGKAIRTDLDNIKGEESKPQLANVTYDYSSKTVSGDIVGVKNLGDYKLILFILTDQWYVKPDFNRVTHKGLSDLQNTDRFLLDAYTYEQYENDIKATKYVIFLVPSSYGGLEHMNDYDGANAVCVYSYMDVIQ